MVDIFKNTKLSRGIDRFVSENLLDNRKGGLKDWNRTVANQFSDALENDLEYVLHSKYFLNLRNISSDTISPVENGLYPAHKDDILAIYEEKKKRRINLVIFIEGIGSGKSTKYSILTYLEWLRLTCKFDPQAYYGMMKDEIIAFISMNRSEAQAKRVTLQKVFPKFQTEFNMEYFPPSKRRGQEIWIPRNNTLIFSGTSSAASALGYNIYGGGVDEANFLEVVEGGKKSASNAGVYDSAQEMHNAMFNRMTSRFINSRTGHLDGMLMMFSSSRYPDDFLEKKVKEHFQLGEHSHIFVRRRSLWEAKPKYYFSGVKVQFDLKAKKILASEDEIREKKKEAEKIMVERAVAA